MSDKSKEAELLVRAREGDQVAFEELMRPHRGTLERYARAFARSDTDAEDIAQEALIRAMKSIDSFKQESSLTTWLYSLTRNAGIDWYRRKRNREYPETFEDEEPITQNGQEQKRRPDALATDKDDVALLYQAIQEFPPHYRLPLILCELEGMTYEEVADIEGIPIGTVRSRLNRARKHLAELLNDVQRLEKELVDNPEPR